MANYESPKGNLIKQLLIGGGGITPPERVLAGLTAEQAFLKPHGSPHSVADIVAHLQHWQNWTLSAISGDIQPMVARAELGWPTIEEEAWGKLQHDFLKGIQEAQLLTEDEAKLVQAISPDKSANSWLDNHTTGSALAEISLHNAHHLGQIILLRRFLNLWPPEGGGVTW